MDRTKAWIALSLLPHIGPRSILKLLEVFHGPEEILKAKRSDLVRLDILTKPQIDSLSTGADLDKVGEVLKTVDKMDACIICLDDPVYPSLLKEITDPPVVLYVKGDISDIQPAIAIVGTRAPSHYGQEITFSLARDLSMRGVSVVSGLARGIDTIAHKGSLEGLGKTVAVLGSGIDVIYPSENKELAKQIQQKGAVISELPLGTAPDAKNFPRRNRIISGISLGVLVIEATIKSGAMITARFAGEQGRLCMATPGAVTNIRSQGPHSLIRQGAILVESADDVLADILPQLQGFMKGEEKINSSSLSGKTEDPVKETLKGQELTIEEIAEETGLTISEISQRLTSLELGGEIVRTRGNRFSVRSEIKNHNKKA